jgi:ABC-type sugar transport system permease subunit
MAKINLTTIRMLNFGFGTAMAWVYFVAVISIIGIAMAIISKRVYYYE